MMNSSESQKPQVFINFRGKALRKNLVSFLKPKLEENRGINVYIDEDETRGRPITTLFERIRESSIALVIFSDKYPESLWCLDELVEIKKQMDKGNLVPFPIFYKVKAWSVKSQTGPFGNTLLKTEHAARKKVDRRNTRSILETEAMIWGWRQALVSIGGVMGLTYDHKCDADFVNDIVVQVKKMLADTKSPKNGLTIIKKHRIHPHEEVTSLVQALNLERSDLYDVNGIVSQVSIDRLVFLDLISLKNPVVIRRLLELVQSRRILLVLLGSLEYYNHVSFLNPSKSFSLKFFYSNVNLYYCSVGFHFEPYLSTMSLGENHLGKFLVTSLKGELEKNQIEVDSEDETKSRTEESGVAVVFFSNKYPKSENCLDELVEIKKLMDAGSIDAFPVFYGLKDEQVGKLKGWFHNRLLKIENEVRNNIKTRDDKSVLDTEAKIWGWRDAISSIASRQGLSYLSCSTDDVFVSDIVTKVKKLFVSKETRETRAATTVVNNIDAALFYSQTSFLHAINRDITDFEGLTDTHNGLVVLRLKGHSNLVFLKLSSHENLVRYLSSYSFKSLTEVSLQS
uniref:Disease resistance protein n=1 Tax=Capsella rubella TaxID=81985 RepID=B2WSA7_9BRAS|nr:disease resistance protein [Capsella rubella]